MSKASKLSVSIGFVFATLIMNAAKANTLHSETIRGNGDRRVTLTRVITAPKSGSYLLLLANGDRGPQFLDICEAEESEPSKEACRLDHLTTNIRQDFSRVRDAKIWVNGQPIRHSQITGDTTINNSVGLLSIPVSLIKGANTVKVDLQGYSTGLLKYSVVSTEEAPEPQAFFVLNQTEAFVGEAFELNAEESFSPQDNPLSFTWKWGDETGSTKPVATNQASASHSYKKAGSYSAEVLVTDTKTKKTSSFKVKLAVKSGAAKNKAPRPIIQWAFNPENTLQVTFDASQSTDDGAITNYSWKFTNQAGQNDTASGKTINYTLSAGGTYGVRLTVTDNKGLTAFVDRVVSVAPTSSLVLDDVLLAPKKYSGTLGQQTSKTEIIQLPAPTLARLRIKNGDGQPHTLENCSTLPILPRVSCLLQNLSDLVYISLYRVNSVSVYVNGILVTDDTSITKQTAVFESIIAMTPTTKVQFGIRGGPLSSITADIQSFEVNQPPKVEVVVTPPTPGIPSTVEFNAGGSTDGNDQIEAYRFQARLKPAAARMTAAAADDYPIDSGWQASPIGQLVFNSAGTYEVLVSVQDKFGAVSTVTTYVNITGNTAPRITNFRYFIESVTSPFKVRATAEATDVDGDSLEFNFSFSNGSATGFQTLPSAATTFDSLGEKSVTITVRDSNGASVSADFLIRIQSNILPIANLNYQQGLPEQSPLTVRFDASTSSDPDGSSAMLKFYWSFGDGSPVVEAGPVIEHTFANAGLINTSVGVADELGGFTSVTKAVFVLKSKAPTPILVSRRTLNSLQMNYDASPSQPGDTPIVRYEIEFGDGTSAVNSAANFIHVYTAAGNYKVLLRVFDQDGDGAQQEFPVTVINGQKPVANINLVSSDNILPATFNFDTTGSFSPNAGARIIQTRWTLPSNETVSTTNLTYRPTVSGNFDIKLEVRDSFGFWSDPVVKTYSATSGVLPIAKITTNKIDLAIDELVDLSGLDSYTLNPNQNLTKFEWTLPSGEKLSGANQRVSFSAAGLHQVTLQVTDSKGYVSNIETIQFNVRAIGSATAVINLAIGPRNVVPVAAVASGSASHTTLGTIVKYDWNVVSPAGGSASYSGETVNLDFNLPGDWTVALRVTDASGNVSPWVSQTYTAISNRAPIAHIAATNTTDTAPATIYFNGLGSSDPDGHTILNWEWTFPNGDKASGPLPNYTFKTTGTFHVTLRVQDEYGTWSELVSKLITIQSNQRPIVFIEVLTDPHNPYRKTFLTSGSYDPDGTIVRYEWVGQTVSTGTPDIGPTFFGNNPEITFDFPNTIPFQQYLIYVIAYDNKGAFSVNSVFITIDNSPSPIKARYEVDNFDSMKFSFQASETTDPDGIKSFEWRDGNSPISMTADFEHRFTSEGMHAIHLRVTDNLNAVTTRSFNVYASTTPAHAIRVAQGQDDASDDFVVDQIEDPAPVTIESIPQMVRLEPRLLRPDAGLSYEWHLDGLPLANSNSIPITFIQNGSHKVSMQVRDGDSIAAKVEREIDIKAVNCGDDEDTVCLKVKNSVTGIQIDSEDVELEFPTNTNISNFENVKIWSTNGAINLDVTEATSASNNKLIVSGAFLKSSIKDLIGPFNASADVQAGEDFYSGEANSFNIAASTYTFSTISGEASLHITDQNTGLPVYLGTVTASSTLILPSAPLRVIAMQTGDYAKRVSVGSLPGVAGGECDVGLKFPQGNSVFGIADCVPSQNLMSISSEKRNQASKFSSSDTNDSTDNIGIVALWSSQSGLASSGTTISGDFNWTYAPNVPSLYNDKITSAAAFSASPLPWEATGDGIVPFDLDLPTEKALECKAFEVAWRMTPRMQAGVNESRAYLNAKKWLLDYEDRKINLERDIVTDGNFAFKAPDPDPQKWQDKRYLYCKELIEQLGVELGGNRCLYTFMLNPEAWGITDPAQVEAAKRRYRNLIEYESLIANGAPEKPKMEEIVSNYKSKYFENGSDYKFGEAPWLPFSHPDSHEYRIDIEYLLKDGTTKSETKYFSSKGLKGDYTPPPSPDWDVAITVNPFSEDKTKSQRLPFTIPPKTVAVKFSLVPKNGTPEITRLTMEKDGQNSLASNYYSAACRLADPGYYIRKVEYDPDLIDGTRLHLSFAERLRQVFTGGASVLNGLYLAKDVLVSKPIEVARAYVSRSIFEKESYIPVDADLTEETAVPNSLWSRLASDRPQTASALNHIVRVDVGHPDNRRPASIELKINGRSAETQILGYPIPNRSMRYRTSYQMNVPVDLLIQKTRDILIANGSEQTKSINIEVTPNVTTGDSLPVSPKIFTPKILLNARYNDFHSASSGKRTFYSLTASPLVSSRMASIVKRLDEIGVKSKGAIYPNDFYLNDASLPFGGSFAINKDFGGGGHAGHTDGNRLDIRTFNVRDTKYELINDGNNIFGENTRFDDIAVLIRASRVAHEMNSIDSSPLLREQECETNTTWPNRCQGLQTVEKCLFIETNPTAGSLCARIHAELNGGGRTIEQVRFANSRLVEWIKRNREALVDLTKAAEDLGESKFRIYHSTGSNAKSRLSIMSLINRGFGDKGKLQTVTQISNNWNWSALLSGKIPKTTNFPEFFLLDNTGKAIGSLDEDTKKRFHPEENIGHFNHYHLFLERP